MKADAEKFGFTFDYLIDETQNVARAYDAACTPDFYLFDRGRQLAYHGQFDASRPRNDGRHRRRPACSGRRRARGQARPPQQTPSIGCNIKWRS